MKKHNKVRSQIAFWAVGLMTAATTQAALVGHWTFDETSGTTAADSSGGGYDGTVVNPVWANGIVGGALELNGTDCNISGFGDVLSTVTDEISISFWVAGDLKAPQNMNGFSGYTNNIRMLNAHIPNGTSVYFDAGYYNNVSTNARDRINKYIGSGPTVRGPWNHWAFTKNATTGYMAIYLNGALWHDSAATGPFNGAMEGVTEFFIGSDGTSSAFYKGLMDDFQLYDNELSASEISDIYTAVTPDYAIAYATATPNSGSIPLDVVFDGATSVSSGSITNYAWDFGDGNTTNGISVSHTYTATNFYTVTLTVTDDGGNVDSVQLEVEAKVPAFAQLDYTVESFAFEPPPSFSTNDLAQTYYLSSSGIIGNDNRTTTDTDHAMLFDGIINGEPPADDDATALVMWDSGSSVTVNFDLTDNPYGFEITNITSIAGWKTGSGGRANQGYEVVVTFVDDSQGVLAEATHWAPNNPAFYWTKVSIFEANNSTNVMASGVKSVTFNFSEDARPGGRVMGREIDIMGYRTWGPLVGPTLVYDGESISWETGDPRNYSVQSILNLSTGNTWGTFTNVVGTPPTTTVDLPPQSQNEEFYRVLVE